MTDEEFLEVLNFALYQNEEEYPPDYTELEVQEAALLRLLLNPEELRRIHQDCRAIRLDWERDNPDPDAEDYEEFVPDQPDPPVNIGFLYNFRNRLRVAMEALNQVIT